MTTIIDHFEQRSSEWFTARLGKITGTGCTKLFGTSVAKAKYINDKACEIVVQSRSDSDSCFSNPHTTRGHEYEDIARKQYMIQTFNVVVEVALVTDNEYLACSPDGLVGDEGMLEIKVLDSNNHFKFMLKISKLGIDGIDKEHYIQMQFNMFVTKRKWCDYLLYNPWHQKNQKDVFIYRVPANEVIQKLIAEKVKEAINEIKNLVEEYHNLKIAI